jgi:hypothetical protein
MMGFDHDMVQRALAHAGGNEQLAINLIFNGEVHGAATACSSAAYFTAPAAALPLVSAQLLRLLRGPPPLPCRPRFSRFLITLLADACCLPSSPTVN